MSQLEDNAKHHDRTVVEQYPWTMYKCLPPAMAISVEATVLKEIYGQELNQEQCGQLLKDAEFRNTFVRCWEFGSFEEIRAHAKNPSQTIHTHRKDGRNAVNSGSLPAGDKTIIANSAFYDVAGDWIINYSSNREEEMAKWISKNDQRVTHNSVAKKRAPNTGRWFIDSPELKELCQWKRPTNRVLWCPGIPGVGKTVIASLAIDYLRRRQKNAFVGFIYFDFKLRSIQDLNFAIGSLYRQVFETCKLEDVLMAFEDMYHTHSEWKTRPTVSELQRAISGALKLFEYCFLVVDALDEYLDQYQDAKVYELLTTLLSLGNHIRLIVTSRPLSGFVDLFKKLGSSRREVEATDDDIGRYVNTRLNGQDFNFEICPILRERVIERVVKAAKGRFLIATLNMDLLADQLNPGDLEDTLDVLPNKEDAAYSGAMERIGGYSGNRRDIAKKAIMLVAYCSRPLSIEELRHALAAKEGRYDVKNYLTPLSTITAACAGILVVRGNNIVFVHFTAQEYFDKSHIRDLHFPDADIAVALTCLDYLTLGILSDDTLVEDEFPDDLLERLPFYDYAALQWGFHSNKSIRKDSGEFSSRVWCFLSENIQAANYNAAYLLYPRNGPRDGYKMDPIPGASLFVSVYHNQVQTTQQLIGPITTLPQSNYYLSYPNTPLVFITQPEQMPIIKAMIAKFGVRLEVHPARSFLKHLVIHGLEEAVQYLLMQPDMNLETLHSVSRGVHMMMDLPFWTSLHAAVVRNHLGIAKHLLDFEAKARGTSTLSEYIQLVDAWGDVGETPFHAAIHQGKVKMVELMLGYGALKNLNSPSDQNLSMGQTPLTAAFGIVEDQSALMTLLLEAGTNVNMCNSRGETPLFLAAKSGNLKILQLFLDHGGSKTLNWKDNDGMTALSQAVCSVSWAPKTEEQVEACVSLLLEQAGIDVNLADHNGCTPLYHAYKTRLTRKVVPLLVCHGAQLPNMADLHADFILKAAEDGVEIVIKMLLEKGEIATEPRDARGNTPLLLATQKWHEEIVEMLLREPWVDVNAQDTTGSTPLHFAAGSIILRRQIMKMLLQHPAIDITKRDNGGCSPFDKMFGLSFADIEERVEMFLTHSKAIPEMVNGPDICGYPPIMYAATDKSSESLGVLLSIPEVNRNIRGFQGRTPLMMACFENKVGSIDLLLQESLVEINAQDNKGMTALLLAFHCMELSGSDPDDPNCRPIRSKRRERMTQRIVAMLLSRPELDVNLPDKAGRTPLWYARWLRYDKIAAMLIERGAV